MEITPATGVPGMFFERIQKSGRLIFVTFEDHLPENGHALVSGEGRLRGRMACRE